MVKGSMVIASPKRWLSCLVRGHDKARLMGVAIAIDPFQVVYVVMLFSFFMFGA